MSATGMTLIASGALHGAQILLFLAIVILGIVLIAEHQ